MVDIAPWGSPPTPILPRWYFDIYQATRLPLALQRLPASGARLLTLGDLETLWEHRSTPLEKQEHDALVQMANRLSPPPDYHVAIPVGLNTNLLLQCPFRVRTLNCLRRKLNVKAPSSLEPFNLEPSPVDEMIVGDLLRINHFGLISLLDLMCVVEAAQSSGYFQNPALTHPYLKSTVALSPHAAPPAQDPPEPPDPADIAWASASVVLRRLLTAASQINGTQTLADAVSSDLGGLATELGMTNYLESIPLDGLICELNLPRKVLGSLNEFSGSLSDREQLILTKRLLTPDPLTLEELGQETNLTRERIRQIEKRVESRLNHPSISGLAVNCQMGVLAMQIRQELGPITSLHKLQKAISGIFPTNTNSADNDLADHNSVLSKMARHLIQQELDYSCTDDLCVTQAFANTIRELKTKANSLADDIGLIDEIALQSCLPSDNWLQYWDALLEQSGLFRLSSHLALRDTQKARTKAALLAIGRPATKEEIGELSCLKPDRAGAQLSLLSDVVRADKHRWGLTEWVEDEYEGIPAEIIQRIKEDGGSTRLNRLLEELPRMFGVAESSIKAYLDTPAFQVEHGWVREADNPTFLLHRLEDVIDGYDTNGDPYWEFEIEDRHLDGYSLHGVPNEVAAALGCEFGSKTKAMVRSPADCPDISIIWRKTSLRGPEIGCLGSALRNASLCGGERAILIIHSESEVSFAPTPRSDQRMGGNTHSTLRSLSPSFANQSREFEGVQIGTSIAGRITASTAGRASQLNADSQGNKGNEA